MIRGLKIKNFLRLCFTEIRLSQVHTHARRYGKLGIGFSQDLILKKGGRPVIYIPYKPSADSSLLEDSIKNVYEKSAGDNEIHRSSKWIMTFIKRMSNGKSEDSIDHEDYFEEMEWRLVHGGYPKNKPFIKGKGKGIYRFVFKADDIKIIIFPNENTMQNSLEDEAIRKFFCKHLPIMVTLEHCRNF